MMAMEQRPSGGGWTRSGSRRSSGEALWQSAQRTRRRASSGCDGSIGARTAPGRRRGARRRVAPAGSAVRDLADERLGEDHAAARHPGRILRRAAPACPPGAASSPQRLGGVQARNLREHRRGAGPPRRTPPRTTEAGIRILLQRQRAHVSQVGEQRAAGDVAVALGQPERARARLPRAPPSSTRRSSAGAFESSEPSSSAALSPAVSSTRRHADRVECAPGLGRACRIPGIERGAKSGDGEVEPELVDQVLTARAGQQQPRLHGSPIGIAVVAPVGQRRRIASSRSARRRQQQAVVEARFPPGPGHLAVRGVHCPRGRASRSSRFDRSGVRPAERLAQPQKTRRRPRCAPRARADRRASASARRAAGWRGSRRARGDAESDARPGRDRRSRSTGSSSRSMSTSRRHAMPTRSVQWSPLVLMIGERGSLRSSGS